ncbi:hypothetical protein [Thalassiella azotivora]
MTRHGGAPGGSQDPPGAPHGFAGAHGDVADLLAAVDAAIAGAVADGRLHGERESLCRKRFHVAAARARHDPHGAREMLRALAVEVADRADCPRKGL